MAPTKKTWAKLESEIAETFRKWRRDPPNLLCALPRRSRGKQYQTAEERTVTVRFDWYVPGQGLRDIRLAVRREARAVDNLALLAVALETVRLAEVRDVTDLLVLLYRQLDPQQAAPPPPPPPKGVGSSGPSAVLHIANDAPLTVAEAAYKALARMHHPDLGGATARMQAINAAIEAIRREKGCGVT